MGYVSAANDQKSVNPFLLEDSGLLLLLVLAHWFFLYVMKTS